MPRIVWEGKDSYIFQYQYDLPAPHLALLRSCLALIQLNAGGLREVEEPRHGSAGQANVGFKRLRLSREVLWVADT